MNFYFISFPFTISVLNKVITRQKISSKDAVHDILQFVYNVEETDGIDN